MVRSWWVIFIDGGERLRWWDLFTRPGFRHVAAVGYDSELKVWVIYDPLAPATRLEVVPDGPHIDGLLGELVSGGKVLRVIPKACRRIAPPMFGCVGAIKALLGIRGGALVPHGLYRQLLRDGAEVVRLSHEGECA